MKRHILCKRFAKVHSYIYDVFFCEDDVGKIWPWSVCLCSALVASRKWKLAYGNVLVSYLTIVVMLQDQMYELYKQVMYPKYRTGKSLPL